MVVLIHLGMSDYLMVAIHQALINNKVTLIGNYDPKIYDDNFTFVNINEFLGSTKPFQMVYDNLSTNPHEFELFCFMRWFILRDFLKSRSLDLVFYIDSDVLLFANAEVEWEKYSQYTMTLLHRTAAISSFITYKGICDLCNFIMRIYSNKDSYEFKKIKSHYDIRQECGLHGGVCDMTLLEAFHYDASAGGGPGRVGEMMCVINDAVYDHSINAQDNGYEMENGIKKIKHSAAGPCVYNYEMGKDIYFNSLHFQGDAKRLMREYYGRLN